MTDQLQEIERLTLGLPQARASEQFGEALEVAGAQAMALLPDLERLEWWQQSLHLLSGKWEDLEQREALDELERLQSVGYQMEAARDKEQLSVIRAAVIKAKQQVETVLRAGLRTWQRRIEADIGSLGTLGDLLVEWPDTRELGGRMTSIRSRGATMKTQFPPSASQMEAHRQLLEDARGVHQDLMEIGAGESVERFLLALATETATLDMVDETVLRWIRGRHSDHRFRLSLSRVRAR